MNTYLWVKTLHVVSSVVLVGTGFGTAYYFYFANRSGQLAVQAHVARLVVRADTWFTLPAVLIQPATGLWMASAAGVPLTAPWLATAVALYIVAGMCWLPVVVLQVRMARLAQACLSQGRELPLDYWRMARLWERLGYPAFAAMLIVFYLMVAKPMMGH